MPPPVAQPDSLPGRPARATRAAVAITLVAVSGLGLAFSVARSWTPPGMGVGGVGEMGGAGRAITATRIDLNTATAAELDLLPRIGPALARRILDDRAEHGPFRAFDELGRVKGIGPRTLERLRPHATASGE